MWPGGAALVDDAAHLALDDLGAGEEDGGVEVALQRRGRARRGGSPRRAAPASRRPTTSAPASPIGGSSSPVPTPKWIRGTPASASAREDLRGVRHDELAVVALATARPAQESNSCTALDAGVDLGAQEGPREVARGGRAARARVAGSACIRALVRAWSATGRPRPGRLASVNGAPANPISGVAPSSADEQADRVGHGGDVVGLERRQRARRRRRVRTGSSMTGPDAGDDVHADADGDRAARRCRRRGSRRRRRSGGPAAA